MERKATMSRDGKAFEVYHDGLPYMVDMAPAVPGIWRAIDIEGMHGFGGTIDAAIKDCGTRARARAGSVGS